MKVGIDKIKIYSIIITVILVSVIIYTVLYPQVLNSCYKLGTDRALKVIVNQIRNIGKPISINVGSDVLVCDLVK